MPTLKTCLLVSDDPDDHQVISEALKEISDNVILLIVVENEQAFRMMKEKKVLPDYLIVDLTSDGMDAGKFLSEINDQGIGSVPTTVVYSTSSDADRFKDLGAITFFNKHSRYSEIRAVLRKIIR